MSEYKAMLRFARISPQKTRLVANTVRGKDINQTVATLTFLNKKPAKVLLKLINSAVANATDIDDGIDVDSLYLKEIQVDEGKPWKRGLARARGRMTPLLKRTSHVRVVLAIKN